jgi:hypothetical protein
MSASINHMNNFLLLNIYTSIVTLKVKAAAQFVILITMHELLILVNRVPPPHLSPFVDNEAEGYIPEYAETIKRLQAHARNEVLPLPGEETEDLEDPRKLLVEGIIDRAEANEAAERKRKVGISFD